MYILPLTMKIAFFALFFLFGLSAYELSFPEPKTEEEALFIRRVADYWEEKEFDLVSSQIEDFLLKNPETSLCNALFLLQGDLALQEQKYQEASSFYEKVDFSKLHAEAVLNKIEALRKLGRYEEVCKECEEVLASKVLDGYTKEQLDSFEADAMYNLTFSLPKESKEFLICVKKAKDKIEKLEDSSLKDSFQKPLAYLYETLGEQEKAEELYLKLAEKIPEEKELYLLKVAEMQLSTDKEKALKTLTRISHLGKEKAGEAFYNRLLLLFDMQRYHELALAKDQEGFSFSPEQNSRLCFLLGKSYYKTGDYARCKEELSLFLQQKSSNQDLKEAYLILLDAAKETTDLLLYEKAAKEFETIFPEEPSLAKVLWVKALLYKDQEKKGLAKQNFLYLLEKFPSFEKKEALLFEYADVEFQNQNWEEARRLFSLCLSLPVEEERGKAAISLLIQASLQNVENNPDKQVSRSFFIEDLQQALSLENLLVEEQEQQFYFLLAKAFFEKEDFPSSKESCFVLLEKEPPRELAARAHLLLAYNHEKEGDSLSFCEQAERALELFPSLEEKGKVHLGLFNSYLENQKMEEAAFHLFSSHLLQEPLQIENRLWLGNFYYQKTLGDKGKIPAKNKDAAEKAICVYKELISDFPDYLLPNENTLELEILRLSELYHFLGNPEEKKAELKNLLFAYQENPKIPWSFKVDLFFELAKTYQEEGKKEEALLFYEKVLAKASLLQKLGAEAAYQTALILCEALPEEDSSYSPEFMRASQLLKDLSLHKNFSQEPLHLQASLRYIDLQLRRKPEQERPFLQILLLEKALDNFTLEEDLLSKDYHNQRKNHPEKEALFKAYISLIEAEALFAEASFLLKKGEPKEILELQKEAFSFLEGIHNYTPFLEERVEKNFKNWNDLVSSLPK